MWFLLIILLAPPVGVNRATVLNAFETYEDCQPERNRIGFEMAESYPYDSDFRIVCEFQEKHSYKVPIRDAGDSRNILRLISDHRTADYPAPD